LEGGINSYPYVQNNPVNRIDFSGLIGVLGPGFKNVKRPPQNPYLPGPYTEYGDPNWVRAISPTHGKAIPGQFGTAGLIPLGMGLIAVYDIGEPFIEPIVNLVEVTKGGPAILIPLPKQQIEKIIDDLIDPRRAGAFEKEKDRGCGR
jgi:hypothetical protein